MNELRRERRSEIVGARFFTFNPRKRIVRSQPAGAPKVGVRCNSSNGSGFGWEWLVRRYTSGAEGAECKGYRCRLDTGTGSRLKSGFRILSDWSGYCSIYGRGLAFSTMGVATGAYSISFWGAATATPWARIFPERCSCNAVRSPLIRHSFKMTGKCCPSVMGL